MPLTITSSNLIFSNRTPEENGELLGKAAGGLGVSAYVAKNAEDILINGSKNAPEYLGSRNKGVVLGLCVIAATFFAGIKGGGLLGVKIAEMLEEEKNNNKISATV